MKAVSRPAVYIGFSYFGTLVLAVFLGESVTPFAAAALLILCALCLLFRQHRAHPARMLVLIAAAAAMTVFSCLLYTSPSPRD